MERPIEGPEPYQSRLTSQEAGKWLNGVSHDTFEQLMGRHLPTVKPIVLHRQKRVWNWMDVACLAYILGRSGQGENSAAPEDGT